VTFTESIAPIVVRKHPRVSRQLRAEEINWHMAPVPDSPSEDLLITALAEAESYRVLAQSAVHALSEMQTACDQKDAVIAHQREEIRVRP
jgi:hypothetical protein